MLTLVLTDTAPGLEGEVVAVALAGVKRTVYRKRADETTHLALRLLRDCKLAPGDHGNIWAPSEAEASEEFTRVSGEEVGKCALQLYMYGYKQTYTPMKPYAPGMPRVKRGMVASEAFLSRVHGMTFNPATGSFCVPYNAFRATGRLLYYWGPQSHTIGVSHMQENGANDLEVGVIRWRKVLWRRLTRALKRESTSGQVVLGTPLYRGTEASVLSVTQTTSTAARLGVAPKDAATLILRGEVEVPKAAFARYQGEPYVRFAPSVRMNEPLVVRDAGNVTPPLSLFDIPERHKRKDPAVFNGQ